MSLEQAIITHALALETLAAAIRETVGSVRQIGMGTPAAAPATTAEDVARDTRSVAGQKAAESNKAIAEADAEVKKAVSKAEAAKEKAQAAEEEKPLVDGLDEQPELTYNGDVRPVLLQLNKAKGKDALAALLKKYGAKTGDQIKAEDFALIRDEANAQLAA